jgi:hypothetical protein
METIVAASTHKVPPPPPPLFFFFFFFFLLATFLAPGYVLEPNPNPGHFIVILNSFPSALKMEAVSFPETPLFTYDSVHFPAPRN